MNKVKQLRMSMTEDNIKDTLAQFGVFVHSETENALIFPTVCHNATGGSPKLYYYKEDKIFRCYTECNAAFDIFDLIIRIQKTRGTEINLTKAVSYTGLKQGELNYDSQTMSDLEYLEELKKMNNSVIKEDGSLTILDKKILENFLYDEIGNRSWVEEGISKKAMDRFSIGYYQPLNAITIPNLNHEGQLIGVRGRFLNNDTKAKYMPIRYKDKTLSHPTGKFLYGFYENKNNIRKKGVVVLFEGEKSVLKMETFYPGSNVSLSTSGKKITLDHLSALLKLGIREVILAYDKDYKTTEERKEKIKEYKKIASILTPYCDVSIIVDYENRLEYKDSPADKGKDVFEDLLKERLKR